MAKFNFEQLKKLYEEKYVKEYGKDAYKHISELLAEAKVLHKKTFEAGDHEQSWRSFKGKNLEKLIIHILEEEISKMGLEIIDGSKLERAKECNLSKEYAKVKRNLLIDYGEFGYHLPDVDVVVYNPKGLTVVCVLSVKVTLRERVAQSAYWKLKLASQIITSNIRVFFITLDEDETLKTANPAKKGRAIVEAELDGTYILSEHDFDESQKVKKFEDFICDLKRLISK